MCATRTTRAATCSTTTPVSHVVGATTTSRPSSVYPQGRQKPWGCRATRDGSDGTRTRDLRRDRPRRRLRRSTTTETNCPQIPHIPDHRGRAAAWPREPPHGRLGHNRARDERGTIRGSTPFRSGCGRSPAHAAYEDTRGWAWGCDNGSADRPDGIDEGTLPGAHEAVTPTWPRRRAATGRTDRRRAASAYRGVSRSTRSP